MTSHTAAGELIEYTAHDVRQMIRASITVYGSQKELAKAWGISQQFLSDVLKGRREPTGAILEHLDIKRIVRYFGEAPF